MVDALAGMIQGLAEEMLHRSKQGSGAEVAGGERVGESGGQFLYRFPLSEPGRFQDDVPLLARLGQTNTAGAVVSVRDGSLTVALEADLGPRIASIHLESNEGFLLERLKARLEALQENQSGFNRVLADAMLEAGGAAAAARAEVPVDLLAGLNPEQRDAVRAAAGGQMLFLWGPPGTGKTTTLARILEALWRAGLSVLLVANTNAAVDAALSKVLERPLGANDGAILRFGPMAPDAPNRDRVAFDVVYERHNRAGQETLRIAQDEHAGLRERARELEAAAGRLRRLQILEREMGALKRRHADLRWRHKTASTALGELQAHIRGLRDQAGRGGFLSAVQAPFLLRQAGRLQEDIPAATAAAAQAQRQRLACELDLQAGEAEMQVCRKQCLGLTSQAAIDRRVAETTEALSAAHRRVQSIQDEMLKMREGLLRGCRLLATTAFRTYLGQIPERTFDAVVIDEASTLILPLAYSVAGLAKSKLVIAGDFRQLGPIVQGDTPACRRWVKQSPFEAAAIPDRLATGRPPASLVMLRSQYRMRAPICEIVSRAFYGGELWTDPAVAERPVPVLPAGSGPLFWVDSGPFSPWVGRPQIGFSRYNLLHVALVEQVVRLLAGAGAPREPQAPSVGVVSPYGAQTRLLQGALAGVLEPSDVSTVHRLQGGERDVVVLDLTDSTGAGLGRFFLADHEEGDRLLNVAVSRAREALVVVANFGFIRAQRTASVNLLRLLDQVQERGRPWPVEDPVPAATGDVSAPMVEAGTTQWFRESAAVLAIQRDAGQAKRSLLLAAPFTTDRGIGRWLATFDAARRRGVRVHVLTRPPERGEQALHARLLAAGCEIELRPGMHEKIVIVDGRVLWEGSLNLLSHRSTTEVMRRSDNRAYCDQVERMLYGRDGAPAQAPPPCPVCGGVQERVSVLEGSRRRLVCRCPSGCAPGATTTRAGTPCPASGCPGRLVLRRGPTGQFFGCSAYPRCRHTEPLAGSRSRT